MQPGILLTRYRTSQQEAPVRDLPQGGLELDYYRHGEPYTCGQAGKSHHFESVSLTNDKGLDGLTDTTVSLWKQGLRVAFWGHHTLQTNVYTHILLPPYQLEKARHWMDYKSIPKLVAGLTQDPPVSDTKNMPLWEFVGYQNNDTKHPRFRVNLVSDKFKKLVSGHVFAHTAPVLSGTVQSDMAVEALFSVHPGWKEQGMIPIMIQANIPTPICVDSSRKVWINYEAFDAEHTLWQLNVSSTSAEGTLPRRHLHGRIHVRLPSDPAFVSQFARFKRLVSYEQCAKLLAQANEPDVEVLQGCQVYKAFSEFIEYSDQYNTMFSVVGKKTECAGRVHRRQAGNSFLGIALHDSFKQVSGLFLNCMSDAKPGEMHIGSDVELVMRSPRGRKDAGYLACVCSTLAGLGQGIHGRCVRLQCRQRGARRGYSGTAVYAYEH